MQEVVIQLAVEPNGTIVVSGGGNGSTWTHVATAAEVVAVRSAVERLLEGFESGQRPLADPVALAQLGLLLRDTYLAPLATDGSRPLEQSEGRLAL